jgi:hypothetical protein
MTTILDILQQLRVPTAPSGHRNVRGGWRAIDCPYCGSLGKFHLGVHPETGAANCWKCGPKSIWQIIRTLTGSKQEASELLAGVRFRRSARNTPENRPCRPPDGLCPLSPAHLSYLAGRGLDGQQAAETWNARGIGLAARLAWRIWIPVEQDGIAVSWTTRSISADNPRRYVSARPDEEAVPIKATLYGEDLCRNAVIVHEGPLDCWRTGPGSVAIYGLSYTSEQVARISRFPLRVICLDNSPDAQKVAGRLARDLSPFAGETFVVRLESGEDPGSADPEETAELRQKFLEF